MSRAPVRPREIARSAARAMALVDVLVAVIMLGVAVSAILALSGRAIAAQRSGENLQIAAMLLDEKLNLVLARGPDNYASRFAGEMGGACDAPYERFRYTLDLSGGTGGEAYVVNATVTWTEERGLKSASVETRIAPRAGDQPDPDRTPSEAVDRTGGGA